MPMCICFQFYRKIVHFFSRAALTRYYTILYYATAERSTERERTIQQTNKRTFVQSKSAERNNSCIHTHMYIKIFDTKSTNTQNRMHVCVRLANWYASVCLCVTVCVLALQCIYGLVYVGISVSTRIYFPTFAPFSESFERKIRLTRQQQDDDACICMRAHFLLRAIFEYTEWLVGLLCIFFFWYSFDVWEKRDVRFLCIIQSTVSTRW